MRYPTNLAMVYNIIRRIDEFKPDVIHLQKGHPWFNFGLIFLKKYPLVTTIHDVILMDWLSQRIPAFTYKPPIKYAKQLIVHGKQFERSNDKRTREVR